MNKISHEIPQAIVREDGLSALLLNIDFHAAFVQRTALDTIAKCCRHLPQESFNFVRDIFPKLEEFLKSSDKKMIESACIAVSNTVDSFKYQSDKLEEMLKPSLIKSLVGLLIPPGNGNIDPSTYVTILKTLTTFSKISTELALSLFDVEIGQVVWKVITGVEVPNLDENGLVIRDGKGNEREDEMLKGLVNRPRERIQEVLALVCEILPGLPKGEIFECSHYLFINHRSLVFQMESSIQELSPES
jgi:E3 ubiquitin-protein ligase TRIP12